MANTIKRRDILKGTIAMSAGAVLTGNAAGAPDENPFPPKKIVMAKPESYSGKLTQPQQLEHNSSYGLTRYLKAYRTHGSATTTTKMTPTNMVYRTQAGSSPPTTTVHCNQKEA